MTSSRGTSQAEEEAAAEEACWLLCAIFGVVVLLSLAAPILGLKGGTAWVIRGLQLALVVAGLTLFPRLRRKQAEIGVKLPPVRRAFALGLIPVPAGLLAGIALIAVLKSLTVAIVVSGLVAGIAVLLVANKLRPDQ